jgi:hypothetical protein
MDQIFLGEVDAVNKRVGRTGSIDFAADILKVGRELHRQNLLAAADGNISVRLDKTKILITPKGTAKGSLTPGELAVMDIDGRVLTGDPSSERQMHLEIYRRCPLARAVVHAHPPTAIAWTLAKPALRELPAESLPEVILAAGAYPGGSLRPAGILGYGPWPGSIPSPVSGVDFGPARRCLLGGNSRRSLPRH